MSHLDDETLARAQADLVAWGVLEAPPLLAPTRRFRAAIARAASELRDEELAGAPAAGHPVERVVARALAAHPLPPGARVARDHEMLVVAVELDGLPEGIRALLDRPS